MSFKKTFALGLFLVLLLGASFTLSTPATAVSKHDLKAITARETIEDMAGENQNLVATNKILRERGQRYLALAEMRGKELLALTAERDQLKETGANKDRLIILMKKEIELLEAVIRRQSGGTLEKARHRAALTLRH